MIVALIESQQVTWWLYVKDGIYILSLFGAIGGGILTAIIAVTELRNNLQQRRVEYVWRQTNTAREMLRDIHQHPLASSAVTMLDWQGGTHSYSLPGQRRVEIEWGLVLKTLAGKRTECREELEVFIWDSFDWLFYFVDRIELYIQAGLLRAPDILPVFEPYKPLIQQHRAVFLPLIEMQEYKRARKFFEL